MPVDAEQLDLEDERGAAGDGRRVPVVAVGDVRGAHELRLLADAPPDSRGASGSTPDPGQYMDARRRGGAVALLLAALGGVAARQIFWGQGSDRNCNGGAPAWRITMISTNFSPVP